MISSALAPCSCLIKFWISVSKSSQEFKKGSWFSDFLNNLATPFIDGNCEHSILSKIKDEFAQALLKSLYKTRFWYLFTGIKVGKNFEIIVRKDSLTGKTK